MPDGRNQIRFGFGAGGGEVVLWTMPLGDESYGHDDMSNPNVEFRLDVKYGGEFLDDDLAPLFDLHLELAKLLKFVELHGDTGAAVFKLYLGFKSNIVAHSVLGSDDKPLDINVGAPLRISIPSEVGVVNDAVARYFKLLGIGRCGLKHQQKKSNTGKNPQLHLQLCYCK